MPSTKCIPLLVVREIRGREAAAMHCSMTTRIDFNDDQNDSSRLVVTVAGKRIFRFIFPQVPWLLTRRYTRCLPWLCRRVNPLHKRRLVQT